MSQRQEVLRMVANDWTCGSTFYESYLPRATARIHELRRDGWLIDRRRCANPAHHHESTQWEWKAIAAPILPDDGEKCNGCSSRLSHTSDCPYRRVGADAESRLPL